MRTKQAPEPGRNINILEDPTATRGFEICSATVGSTCITGGMVHQFFTSCHYHEKYHCVVAVDVEYANARVCTTRSNRAAPGARQKPAERTLGYWLGACGTIRIHCVQ